MHHIATDTNWAVSEFADAELGDERRTKRLVELANVLGQHPTAALPEACGDGGMLKAAYRFFDNDAIDAQDLLQSHIESTYRRLDYASVVLAVQDTTEVNWTRHPATQGLGPLGHTACHGLLVHTTLAFTPERVPLGLLDRKSNTSELQSPCNLVCRLLLEKKKTTTTSLFVQSPSVTHPSQFITSHAIS